VDKNSLLLIFIFLVFYFSFISFIVSLFFGFLIGKKGSIFIFLMFSSLLVYIILLNFYDWFSVDLISIQ